MKKAKPEALEQKYRVAAFLFVTPLMPAVGLKSDSVWFSVFSLLFPLVAYAVNVIVREAFIGSPWFRGHSITMYFASILTGSLIMSGYYEYVGGEVFELAFVAYAFLHSLHINRRWQKEGAVWISQRKSD